MKNNQSLLDQLVNIICEINPIQKNYLSLNSIELSIEDLANDYILYLLNHGYSIENIAAAYSWLCNQVIKEQIYFKKYGKYRYSNAGEVAEKVYTNNEYMGRYMIGVAISQFLWPQHHELFNFWLKHIKNVSNKKYLEIGVGHGLFFQTAIQLGGFLEYIGVDISETSLLMTQELLKSKIAEKNVKFVLNDIMELNQYDNMVDFITMGEVLEHVEEPQLLVDKVEAMLIKGGLAYISTCANAPVIDHIYLFNNINEIREVLYKANLEIIDEIVICNDNTLEKDWDEAKANLSYAAIARKK